MWRHCASESYGRSGLAMYIPGQELAWRAGAAPALNYRVSCTGGEYTLWLLCKFNLAEEGRLALTVDGSPVPKIYGGGSLWRYEAEQIYRWVPLAKLILAPGGHILCIQGLAAGLRFDRMYLTKGSQKPPRDLDWGQE